MTQGGVYNSKTGFLGPAGPEKAKTPVFPLGTGLENDQTGVLGPTNDTSVLYSKWDSTGTQGGVYD